MTDNNNPTSNVVAFFAAGVNDATIDVPPHLNDNCCPHCGGAMAPGDRAADCSRLQLMTTGAMPVRRAVLKNPRDRARG